MDIAEAPPQPKEPTPIELGQLFDPYKELSKIKVLPDNFESHFDLPGVGEVVFRFSKSIPEDLGDLTLADSRYLWAEIALDSNLEESRYDELLQGLELIVNDPTTKKEYLGFAQVQAPQLDRYQFKTWGLTHEFATEVPKRRPAALLVKEKNIPKIAAIIKFSPL